MTESSPSSRPSRRAVLTTALWSVPAVSLATAAPAFADSGQAELVFAGDVSVNFDGVLSVDESLVSAQGAATTPAQVTMTVTLVNGSGESFPLRTVQSPTGWTQQGSDGTLLVFVSNAAVSSEDAVGLDGFIVERERGGGTYRLDFAATDYLSTVYTVAFAPA